jgi:group I intron endonuclease
MTCGIYLLRFTGTTNVYIGQSQNIEYRFKKHIQKMRKGNTTLKLQQAYNNYGEPAVEILLECKIEELNTFEEEAIQIYDALKCGFNTATEADIYQKGDKNGASKYSNADISNVLDMLLNASLSYQNIEDITKVKLNTVRHIANEEAHVWLKDTYPDKYKKMLEVKAIRRSITNSAGNKGKSYPALLSPDGLIYNNIENVSAFAKEHNLDPSSITKVLNKRPRYLSHKGWKLA